MRKVFGGNASSVSAQSAVLRPNLKPGIRWFRQNIETAVWLVLEQDEFRNP